MIVDYRCCLVTYQCRFRGISLPNPWTIGVTNLLKPLLL